MKNAVTSCVLALSASFVVCVSAFVSPGLQAQNAAIPLYLQPIPHYMDSTEKGTYVDLMRRFAEQQGIRFKLSMTNSERMEQLLVAGKETLCTLGFSVELAVTEGLPTAHLIESQSFNRIYTSIISRRTTPVNTVEDLDQKSLVVYYGNIQDAKKRIPDGINTSIVTVSDLDTLLRTILNNRVDAGFVTMPDILMSPLFQQSRSQLFLTELPDSERRESLVCIDAEQTRPLINRFNQYIDALRATGELASYIDYQQGTD